MLPVVKALRLVGGFKVVVAVTGQHRQMLDQVFVAFSETPDVDLDLMTSGQTLGEITSRVLGGVEGLIRLIGPDVVLVHGDTTTAMAAALAAFYLKVPIGHVEAGLRSHDLSKPWPEEFNRVAIDSVADLLFAPTERAAEHLRRESPRSRQIFVTGNTGIDALILTAATTGPTTLRNLPMTLDGRRLVLVTGHRRESFGNGFQCICDGLSRIAARSDVQIVYPVHLNPEVRDVVTQRLGGLSNVHLLPPVTYPEMVALMKRAHFILTDSGGVQEEAPALGVPVLVMRDVTERPEAIETGVASLVGADADRIEADATKLLDDPEYYSSRARPVFPYGDGTASAKIVSALENFVRTR